MQAFLTLPLLILVIAIVLVLVAYARSARERVKIAQRKEDEAAQLPVSEREGSVFSRWGGLYAAIWGIALLLVAGSLYVVLSGCYDAGSQRFAFGAMGVILGYWFGSRR
jgi:hypothetical protein